MTNLPETTQHTLDSLIAALTALRDSGVPGSTKVVLRDPQGGCSFEAREVGLTYYSPGLDYGYEDECYFDTEEEGLEYLAEMEVEPDLELRVEISE